jgi:hypothetical protein
VKIKDVAMEVGFMRRTGVSPLLGMRDIKRRFPGATEPDGGGLRAVGGGRVSFP